MLSPRQGQPVNNINKGEICSGCLTRKMQMSRKHGRDPRTQVNAPIAGASEPARFCPFSQCFSWVHIPGQPGGSSGRTKGTRQSLALCLARWVVVNVFSICWRQFRQKSTHSLFRLKSSLQTRTCMAIFFFP